MGFVASPSLVATVAEAGGIGLIPGSLGTRRAAEEIGCVRDMTDKPFGVNLPIAFIANPRIVDLVAEEQIPFVTTSAGPPTTYTDLLKSAGITVLHVVTSLETAREAADLGVDGLIVEGVEGAGLRGEAEVSSMVLVPLIARNVDLPIIAAGGISDGAAMAAAFALGAEGVQMGTRMLASTEANVHADLKAAVLQAAETDTVLINRHNKKPFRALRTQTTGKLEFEAEGDPVPDLLQNVPATYVRGEIEGSLASVGQVAGRIDALLSAGQIVANTVEEFGSVVSQLWQHHLTTHDNL
jgi:enoyl-[acyl-carrier protein] reductase II